MDSAMEMDLLHRQAPQTQPPHRSLPPSTSPQHNQLPRRPIERLPQDIAYIILTHLSLPEQIFFGLSSPYIYSHIPLTQYRQICHYPRRSAQAYIEYEHRLERVLREAQQSWKRLRPGLWCVAQLLLGKKPSDMSTGVLQLFRHHNAMERVLCLAKRRADGLRGDWGVDVSLRLDRRCERLLDNEREGMVSEEAEQACSFLVVASFLK